MSGVRECFAAATEGFVEVVSAIDPEGWGRPGLGEWTVRDLVGHTGRALSTIETYLAHPPDDIVMRDPVDYLLAARQFSQGGAAIAERGREAGAALGDDPKAAVRALASRVTALVGSTPDDAALGLALGGATLLAYLPTRTFELTVHTLDLCGALGIDRPTVLAEPVAACLELAVAVLRRRGDGASVLSALTGRGALPAGFTIL